MKIGNLLVTGTVPVNKASVIFKALDCTECKCGGTHFTIDTVVQMGLPECPKCENDLMIEEIATLTLED